LRHFDSRVIAELVYKNTRVFYTIGTPENINSARLEDVEGNMRSHKVVSVGARHLMYSVM
jgi:hypothetical protein